VWLPRLLNQVLEVSRRLLQLHQLLGGSDDERRESSSSGILGPAPESSSVSAPELVWMVTREPGAFRGMFVCVCVRVCVCVNLR